MQRISHLQLVHLCREEFEKAVGDGLDGDESLRCHAGLAGIMDTAPEGCFDGRVKIRIVQHDEGIAAAQFHRGLL